MTREGGMAYSIRLSKSDHARVLEAFDALETGVLALVERPDDPEALRLLAGSQLALRVLLLGEDAG